MAIDDFARIAAQTLSVYERNAARFDAERRKDICERDWLERFCGLVPSGGTVLDLGCGAGEPIGRYLMEQGYAITGVDFSEPMLAIARDRLPSARWLHADMRSLALGESFDGIVAWHSFFHLRPAEQRDVLRRLALHLRPGGALMLTVGPSAGEVIGRVGDDPVYHASLAPGEYTAALASLAIDVSVFETEDPGCGGSTILLAHKRHAAAD